MERFEHMMRTTQHTKSVEMIMTRTSGQFYHSKKSHSRPAPQGQNLTTYLRKFQIDRQNLNLAKRIMQCESEHSKDRYSKQWKKTKRFLKVRSNFKKTLHAKQPKIFKFEPILGTGKLRVDFKIVKNEISHFCFGKNNLYKFVFVLGNHEVEPDKKLLTIEFLENYQTTFYAPLFLKKRKITCKIQQVCENDFYESARFQIDFSVPGSQTVEVFNKHGKSIGKISFDLTVEGGRNKNTKNSMIVESNKENIETTRAYPKNQRLKPLCETQKVKYSSESQF